MKAKKIEFPRVDLAGLSVSNDTWNELRFFQFEAEQFETLSDILDLAVREWISLQGAALRMKEVDDQRDADAMANVEARAAKTPKRANKASKRITLVKGKKV